MFSQAFSVSSTTVQCIVYILMSQHIDTFCLWAAWVNFYIINGHSTFCLCHCHGHSFLYHRILIFLSIFYCCICFKNQCRWLSSKTSASTSSKSTFEEKLLSQRSQTSGLLLFAISLYNVWFMMLPWPMRLGILSYVVQFFICNLQVVGCGCLLISSKLKTRWFIYFFFFFFMIQDKIILYLI